MEVIGAMDLEVERLREQMDVAVVQGIAGFPYHVGRVVSGEAFASDSVLLK